MCSPEDVFRIGQADPVSDYVVIVRGSKTAIPNRNIPKVDETASHENTNFRWFISASRIRAKDVAAPCNSPRARGKMCPLLNFIDWTYLTKMQRHYHFMRDYI